MTRQLVASDLSAALVEGKLGYKPETRDGRYVTI